MKNFYPTLFVALFASFITGCQKSAGTAPTSDWVRITDQAVVTDSAPPVERKLRISDRIAGLDKQAQLIDLINKTRRDKNLDTLREDDILSIAAQNYARKLSKTGDIQHVEPDGTTPGDRAYQAGYKWQFIAENLASGQDSPAETVKDWLDSPKHRDAMLHAEPVHIGIGHVHNPDDRLYKEYWVMLVAAPR